MELRHQWHSRFDLCYRQKGKTKKETSLDMYMANHKILARTLVSLKTRSGVAYFLLRRTRTRKT